MCRQPNKQQKMKKSMPLGSITEASVLMSSPNLLSCNSKSIQTIIEQYISSQRIKSAICRGTAVNFLACTTSMTRHIAAKRCVYSVGGHDNLGCSLVQFDCGKADVAFCH